MTFAGGFGRVDDMLRVVPSDIWQRVTQAADMADAGDFLSAIELLKSLKILCKRKRAKQAIAKKVSALYRAMNSSNDRDGESFI